MAVATSHCTEITFYATFDSSISLECFEILEMVYVFDELILRNYVTLRVEWMAIGEIDFHFSGKIENKLF